MTNRVNTELIELASDHIDYWAGEGIGAVIIEDIHRGDLDALQAHIKESAKLMFDLEYNPTELEATDAY